MIIFGKMNDHSSYCLYFVQCRQLCSITLSERNKQFIPEIISYCIFAVASFRKKLWMWNWCGSHWNFLEICFKNRESTRIFTLCLRNIDATCLRYTGVVTRTATECMKEWAETTAMHTGIVTACETVFDCLEVIITYVPCHCRDNRLGRWCKPGRRQPRTALLTKVFSRIFKHLFVNVTHCSNYPLFQHFKR